MVIKIIQSLLRIIYSGDITVGYYVSVVFITDYMKSVLKKFGCLARTKIVGVQFVGFLATNGTPIVEYIT